MVLEKSAVDFFFEEMGRMQYFIGNDLLQAYKESQELHRSQITKAYNKGEFDCGCNGTAEDYYNKTYNEKL